MVDYWSVVVDCSRSKIKGLNPLQIYNMKQALSSILTIIFLHIFCKNPQRSQIHRFTCSQGGDRDDRENRDDRESTTGTTETAETAETTETAEKKMIPEFRCRPFRLCRLFRP